MTVTRPRPAPGMVRWPRVLFAALLLVMIAAPVPAQPLLTATEARLADGYPLPVRRWGDLGAAPAVVVLALHGFNDYGQSFAALGRRLADDGILLLAVDQRGFGATAGVGRWHGTARLAADLRALTALLAARYPQAQRYVLGESMGGAVALTAAAAAPLPVAGLILLAPAVWSRDTMPWYQRLALETAVRFMPAARLTGRGVRVRPSDHRVMLRAMAADPLVIRATRVDALWGIANLMDAARAAAPQVTGLPVLLLYGERDQVIPPHAFCRLLAALPPDPQRRLALYRDGWHLLTRDLQGARVQADVAAWLQDPTAPLPSGEETALDSARVRALCRRAGTTRPSLRP